MRVAAKPRAGAWADQRLRCDGGAWEWLVVVAWSTSLSTLRESRVWEVRVLVESVHSDDERD